MTEALPGPIRNLMEQTCCAVIATRAKYGAKTPIGHRCSNIDVMIRKGAPPNLIAFQMLELERLLDAQHSQGPHRAAWRMTMPTYRKMPVEIEAVQLPVASAPSWLADAMDAGTTRLFDNGTAEIDTLEGTMTAGRGDWIIQGVKGELYPCKPDIFGSTYEEVKTLDDMLDGMTDAHRHPQII